jgi:hypothetical protein
MFELLTLKRTKESTEIQMTNEYSCIISVFLNMNQSYRILDETISVEREERCLNCTRLDKMGCFSSVSEIAVYGLSIVLN